MANESRQVGGPIGGGQVVVPTKVKGSTTADGDGLTATVFNATKDLNALRAALTASNGTYYTTARLNTMSENDMVYCWMQINGIKN